MKLAYLITAYNQPKFLARLIRALNTENSLFFVHVDKNVNIAPFCEACRNLHNVVFIENRKKVTWMGFSQVESILELMSTAQNYKCSYYNLLSGSDYPIKSNQYISDFFSKSDDEYITFWRLEDRPSWLHKIQLWYAIDWVPIWNYQSASFRRYYWGYFYKLSRFIPKREFLKGYLPYGGSDWWSLSHEAVGYILSAVRDNPSLCSFFRYTHCPSELFFHTIILNSYLATRVRNYYQYNNWRKKYRLSHPEDDCAMLTESTFNFRYIDWSPDRTGGHGRPAVLNIEDFGALKNSPCLFARKFDEVESARLADKIDLFRLT